MRSSRQRFLAISALLFKILGVCDASIYNQEKSTEQSPTARTYPLVNTPPYWEYILREFIFKTISPPPPGNNVLYKRFLDAPFYGGPFPIVSKDEKNVVLSRGDVYYLPNNHWIFCQEGCTDCEVCTEQKVPIVKWILRRIQRISSHGSPRYDLQVTIIPQVDGSYHMRNLSPRSYVYVTTPGERMAYTIEKFGYHNIFNAFSNLNDTVSDQKQKHIADNFWKIVGRDSMPDRHQTNTDNNTTSITNNLEKENDANIVSMESKNEEESEHKHNFHNFQEPRLKIKSTEKPENYSTSDVNTITKIQEETKQLIPKLILGTDPQGQRHLVHVVPAENTPTTGVLTNSILSNSPILVSSNGYHVPRVNQITQDYNRAAYQRILRRIFDNLHNHRRSIQDFLEQSTNRIQRNEDFAQIEIPDVQIEESQQQETRHNLTTQKEINYLDPHSDEVKKQASLYRKLALPLNWDRQKRKAKNITFRTDFLNNTIDPNDVVSKSHRLSATVKRVIDNTISGRDKDTIPIQYNNQPFGINYLENEVTNTSRTQRLNPEMKFLSPTFNMNFTTESTINILN